MSRWNPEPIEVRFYDRALPEPNSGCWLWTGEIDGGGYGSLLLHKFKEGGRWRKLRAKAHRLSWELHRGPIPDGMEICHTCDMPGCVNPDHLFVGAHKQNMDDRDMKGRVAAGERQGGAKLTEHAVRQIMVSPLTSTVLGKRFGVHIATVSDVRCGKTWRHLGLARSDDPKANQAGRATHG